MTRDDKGRFPKGVSGNPKGRKARPTEEKYLAVFKQCVDEEDIKAIARKAVEQAKRGDPMARKFIFDYLVGPPVQKNETQLTGSISILWDLPKQSESAS